MRYSTLLFRVEPFKLIGSVAAIASLALLSVIGSRHRWGDSSGIAQAATTPTAEALPAADPRRGALIQSLAGTPAGRDTHNIALDARFSRLPVASSEMPNEPAWLAVDGDPNTAWRAPAGTGPWTWTMPFAVPVHLGLIRMFAGDTAADGVPAAYRWEVLPSQGRGCSETPSDAWVTLPGGAIDDRDPNEWAYGPKDVHAQKQVFFTDADACALRLTIVATDGGKGPMVREVSLYQSARSLTHEAGVEVSATSTSGRAGSSLGGMIDGAYEKFWEGEPGKGMWTVEVSLPAARKADRLWLELGENATLIPYSDRAGEAYSVAGMPLQYAVQTRTAPDAPWKDLPEASPPAEQGRPLPVRRRLVHFAPREVQAMRIAIDGATNSSGAVSDLHSAPVIRDLALYEASDARPAITEPLFLSVNTNPAALVHGMKRKRRTVDGSFARDFSHRLRRIVSGFERDSAWPADAHRQRDAHAGRVNEIIEADDPQLNKALLSAMAPPPVVLLSGGGGWDFAPWTSPEGTPAGRFHWDTLSDATDPNRGIGQLTDAVRDRVAPFLGFCGGEQNLALLVARGVVNATACHDGVCPSNQSLYDAVLARNNNQAIRGDQGNPAWDERAFWTDKAAKDSRRPRVQFDPTDPLFQSLAGVQGRRSTRELPSLHGDMVRWSAFSSLLSGLKIAAWTDYCHTWVRGDGPEPTTLDPTAPRKRCVRIPHAFRTTDDRRFPLIGLQFHADGKDLQRLMPEDPSDARGDALNVFANAVDLAVESYLRVWWPGA